MLLRRHSNLFYGIGRRHRRRRVGVRRKRRGAGFSDIIRGAHDFIKSHKLVSRIAHGLSAVGVPYAGSVASAADSLGYGRRRRHYRRRRGGNLKSVLSSAHKFIKDKRLVSSALRHFAPKSNLHKAAHVLGYGRRRTYRRRRGGNLKSVLSSAHKFIKDKRLVSSALRHFAPKSNLHKAAHVLGYGRRRTYRRRRGGALKDILSSAHKFIKDKILVSSALRHFAPKSNLHKAAHVLGYGRRRRTVRHRGGANFFSTEQIAAPKF